MENYILHELHGQSPTAVELTHAKSVLAPEDTLADGMGEIVSESAAIPVIAVFKADTSHGTDGTHDTNGEHATDHSHAEHAVLIHEPGQCVEFIPAEEPNTDWVMELAEAYVRAQVLEGVFPPEDGLKMGTAFPNLFMPYCGRD